MQKTGIIYARQSSGKEEGSESIEIQIEKCKELARHKKIKVVDVFYDANISGRIYPAGADSIASQDFVFQNWLEEHSYEKNYRVGLGDAIKIIPNVDYVIFFDLTRLYRPLQGSYMQDYIDGIFKKNKTKMLSIKEGEIDPVNASEYLIRSIKSNINDSQLKITAEKSRMALKKLRDSGICPTMPKMFGIRYIGGKNKEVEVIPEAAEAIRFVYKRILALDSYNSIIRQLNDKYPHLCSGNGYYSTSLRHIAAQPFYCGYMYDTQNTLIPAKQMQGKEIISLADWQKVQEIMGRKRRNPKGRNQGVHPFSHLLYCGNCGSKMIIGLDGGKEYYHCYHGSHDKGLEECRLSRTTINHIRKSTEYSGLREAIAPILTLAFYKELENAELSTGEQKKLSLLKDNLEKYLERLNEITQKYSEGELDIGIVTRISKELENKISATKNNIFKIENAYKNREDVINKISKYFENIEEVINNKLDDAIYEDLLHKSINKIICFRDHIDVETVYGNFELKKYIKKRFRNFPRFNYEFQGSKKERNFSNTKLIINYDYTNADNYENNKLIVDFGVMKISSINENSVE